MSPSGSVLEAMQVSSSLEVGCAGCICTVGVVGGEFPSRWSEKKPVIESNGLNAKTSGISKRRRMIVTANDSLFIY